MNTATVTATTYASVVASSSTAPVASSVATVASPVATATTPTLKRVMHTILFHGNCIDGWFAAYIAHSYFKQFVPVQMFPVAPGQPNTFPDVNKMEETNILLVDVSVSKDIRDKWMENKNILTIHCIDHHESSIEHWPVDNCPIETSCCAAIQTYHNFYPSGPIPFWLNIIDRIDRWVDVQYEDRCIRELLYLIAHKPVQKKMNEAFALTEQFIYHMDIQPNIPYYISLGKEILDKKDAALSIVIAEGYVHTFTQQYIDTWKLPETWLGLNVYILDNTNIVIDSSEASYLVFLKHPDVQVYINYRKKSFYVKEGNKQIMKSMYVYSARSRGFNLTTDTIFNGHPTSAGASLVIGETELFPFLRSQPQP